MKYHTISVASARIFSLFAACMHYFHSAESLWDCDGLSLALQNAADHKFLIGESPGNMWPFFLLENHAKIMQFDDLPVKHGDFP